MRQLDWKRQQPKWKHLFHRFEMHLQLGIKKSRIEPKQKTFHRNRFLFRKVLFYKKRFFQRNHNKNVEINSLPIINKQKIFLNHNWISRIKSIIILKYHSYQDFEPNQMLKHLCQVRFFNNRKIQPLKNLWFSFCSHFFAIRCSNNWYQSLRKTSGIVRQLNVWFCWKNLFYRRLLHPYFDEIEAFEPDDSLLTPVQAQVWF